MERQAAPQGVDGQGVDLAELSNAMVAIYKEVFGRGPTKVRSHYAGPDIIISTLENTFTPVERTMTELGERVRVEETRLFFQRATRDQFIGAVEELTGRKVVGFISGTDTEVDLASEVFYLEPQDGSG